MGHYRAKPGETPSGRMKGNMEWSELSCLVDELSKPSPCKKTVKLYMERFQLPYSDDSIESLQTVLQALYQEGVHENSR